MEGEQQPRKLPELPNQNATFAIVLGGVPGETAEGCRKLTLGHSWVPHPRSNQWGSKENRTQASKLGCGHSEAFSQRCRSPGVRVASQGCFPLGGGPGFLGLHPNNQRSQLSRGPQPVHLQSQKELLTLPMTSHWMRVPGGGVASGEGLLSSVMAAVTHSC